MIGRYRKFWRGQDWTFWRLNQRWKFLCNLDDVIMSLCIRQQEVLPGEPGGAGINGHRYGWEDLFPVGGMEGYISEAEGRQEGEGQHQGQGLIDHTEGK